MTRLSSTPGLTFRSTVATPSTVLIDLFEIACQILLRDVTRGPLLQGGHRDFLVPVSSHQDDRDVSAFALDYFDEGES